MKRIQLPACLRHRRLTLVALLLAEAAVLFPGAVLRGESFFERDLLVDWYQRIFVLTRCLREGAWPLWDPSLGFGYPLLADPGAQILYPPAWAAFALPVRFGYTAFVLVHLVLGGLGIACLARALGVGSRAAAAVACLWLASGPVQSILNLRHHLAGAAWLPWVLLSVDCLVRAPGLRTVLGAAAAVSAQVLAGSPDMCALTVLCGIGWVLFRLVEQPRQWPAAVRGLAAAGALAAGLTAAQWWPALDVLSRSTRRALSEDVRGFWSVPLSGLVRLALPLDPRRVPFEAASWTRLFDAAEPPFLSSIYLGASVILLAVIGLVAPGQRRVKAALAGIAAIAAACALGPHAPFYGWAMSIAPPLQMLRYPSKALLVSTPLLMLLAGFGIDAVEGSFLSRRSAWALCATTVGLGVVASTFDARYPAGSVRLVGVALILSALVVALAAQGWIRARAAGMALAAICTMDLLAAHVDLNATVRIRTLLQSPPAATLAGEPHRGRIYVYDYGSRRGTSLRLLGRFDPYLTADPPPGVDRRAFAALGRALYMPSGLAGLYGLENSYDLDLRGLYPRDLNDLTFYLRFVEGTPVFAKLLRMGAVGTVLSLHRAGLDGLQLEHELPSLFPEPILVWRVPGALPRAWIVGCARVADRGDAFRVLASADYDPAREVILPRPAGVGDGCGPAGTARLISRRPDRLSIDADASRSGYLVLADAWDPGWRVTLDGRPAPLLRADIAFRGVFLPAGRHLVEMVYRPRPVVIGAGLSFLSLVAILGLGFVARARGARGSLPH
jgi:hypothetical protein